MTGWSRTRDSTVLVVEDDRATARLLELYLRRDGHKVATCYDGSEGLKTALHSLPDLIILDVMLPGMDGLEFCRRLREVANIPVIFLSARATEDDKLHGLGLGADDYVSKPFSPSELVARVQAVLRRVASVENPPGPVELTARDITIDYRRRRVTKNGNEVHLTPIEYRLLCTLFNSGGRVFTRQLLIDVALGPRYEGLERSVDVHIRNLRRKIEPDPEKPTYVQTVHGVGYRFNPDLTT